MGRLSDEPGSGGGTLAGGLTLAGGRTLAGGTLTGLDGSKPKERALGGGGGVARGLAPGGVETSRPRERALGAGGAARALREAAPGKSATVA
ncbi:MAG: hypothetical protein L6Q76_24665, partial [Polyangiaceae bacterium]|nr:hypothetical protein [Polyangiaceae bacterium]